MKFAILNENEAVQEFCAKEKGEEYEEKDNCCFVEQYFVAYILLLK